MFGATLGLVRSDVERQLAWARHEAKRHTRRVAATIAFAALGAVAAIGAAIVGLMALYTWAEFKYGAMPAFGIVGGLCAVVALFFFTLAFMRDDRPVRTRPAVRAADPQTLGLAVKQDVNAETAALMSSLRGSAIGPALSAGEDALKRSEQVVRFAQDVGGSLGGSRKSVLVGIGIAAVIGLVVGRRI